jgi:hypothetical protein
LLAQVAARNLVPINWMRVTPAPRKPRIIELTMRSARALSPVWGAAQGAVESSPAQEPIRARRRVGTEDGQRSWLSEPKSAVWIILALIILIGGSRRLLALWRARRAIALLDSPDVTVQEIEAAADHGRSGAYGLLHIFSVSESEPRRRAAGRALARLWLDDQLIAEEEKALVRRGYSVTWSARRRYPRALQTEIPIEVSYEVPFLQDEDRRVRASNLEWSHRVVGARRASLEEFSPWLAGRGRVAFTIVPSDFETNGPHRLVLHTRVRTRELSDAWEIELPQMPFQFDFDPMLRPDAILTLADAVRDEAVSKAIQLEPGSRVEGAPARYLTIDGDWALRNPPALAVSTPLPCDLAHTISLEVEGLAGLFPAGRVILCGQGLPQRGPSSPSSIRYFELGPLAASLGRSIERPGLLRARVILVADPSLGWADPDIRSVWPGQTRTDWMEVEVVRR